MYEYIGKTQVSFEYGSHYEALPEKDDVLGDCYAIKDESGEWYCYEIDFFNNNFREVAPQKKAV